MTTDQFDYLLHAKYLGDGVHFGVDPHTGSYVLWTERLEGVHYIYLSNDEIEALIRHTGRDA